MTVRSASQKRRWISRSCSFLFLNWLALCFRSIITYHGLDTTPDLMAACGRSFPTFFSTTPSYPIVLPFCRFLWDSVTIYLLFLSFGATVPIGLTVIAPNIGRLFGLLTFIPGGVGTFEGAMVLVFNSLGVTLELAFAVMMLYRFFSYWLYFPLGLIFYKQLSREEEILV